jgi:hypothetical protein
MLAAVNGTARVAPRVEALGGFGSWRHRIGRASVLADTWTVAWVNGGDTQQRFNSTTPFAWKSSRGFVNWLEDGRSIARL